MSWNVAEAKQRFSEVVRAAENKPQLIYNRGKLVAAVVSAGELREFLAWRKHKEEPTIAEAFGELRRICSEEDYELEAPAREDRPNPFCGIPVLNPFT